jgi:uncharacterized protein YecE (DUF72 family)
VTGWVAATPPSFRFVVKAQRSASVRALYGDAAASVGWMLEPLDGFGERLGGVLWRIPAAIPRDDGRLAGLLGAWPADIPLVLEAQHPSWHVDETFRALTEAGAALCATDLDGADPPDVRRTGACLYLRLRRTSYPEVALDAWARRVAPFVADGMNAYVLFRHDENGTSAVHAEGFAARVARAMAAG